MLPSYTKCQWRTQPPATKALGLPTLPQSSGLRSFSWLRQGVILSDSLRLGAPAKTPNPPPHKPVVAVFPIFGKLSRYPIGRGRVGCIVLGKEQQNGLQK